MFNFQVYTIKYVISICIVLHNYQHILDVGRLSHLTILISSSIQE